MSAASLQVSIAVANWTVAVANVVLFVIAFWSLRSDRRRLSKMEMADRQKYAENVYAWIEERSADTLTIACRNGGASTIYDVTIRVEDPTGKVLGDTYGIELMKPLEEKTCLATGMSMARDARRNRQATV